MPRERPQPLPELTWGDPILLDRSRKVQAGSWLGKYEIYWTPGKEEVTYALWFNTHYLGLHSGMEQAKVEAATHHEETWKNYKPVQM